MSQSYMDKYIQKYLAALNDDQLLLLVRQKVFAKLTLTQKVKLLEALQQDIAAQR